MGETSFANAKAMLRFVAQPEARHISVEWPSFHDGRGIRADIRLAAESAYFRAAGTNNGLTATELGLSFLLPRAIGSSRAFEIMLSGRDIDAHEAAAMGLVSRVVPDDALLDEALELADRINGWSAQGMALTKRMMWAGLETSSLRAAIEMESHTQLFVRMTTGNFEEAARARREGRPPDFQD